MNKDEKLIRRALELVRDGLRSGAIPAENFDMKVLRADLWVGQPVVCRTVCCIAGWAQELMVASGCASVQEAGRIAGAAGSLRPLFAPLGYKTMQPTGPEAANAIDRSLAGKEPWPRAVS